MADPGSSDPQVTALVVDFLKYKLDQSGYQWSFPAPAGLSSSKVGSALRALADEFSAQYKENFVEMCEQLRVDEGSSVKPAVVGVANELFSEGIRWARIVAFFVFGGELALHCHEKNLPNQIDVIAHSLAAYISEKLLPWINDHGGWEGLIVFNETTDSERRNNDRWPSMKNLLCLGISAIGALSLGALLSKS